MTIKVEKLKAWPWLADSRGTHSCQCVCLGFNKDKTLRVYACPCVLVYSSSVSSGTTLVRVGEMSAHPSTWHLQSRLLSVSLFTSFSFIRLRYSELFLLLLTSLALFLSHVFFVVFFFHSFKSLTSLSLLISFPFTAVILFPSFSPVLSVDTEIHLICVSQNRADGNLFFSVCVCVLQKTIRCSECGCPLKKLYTKLLFWLSRALSKVENNWPFSPEHMWHQLLFLSDDQSSQKQSTAVSFLFIYICLKRKVCKVLIYCIYCWLSVQHLPCLGCGEGNHVILQCFYREDSAHNLYNLNLKFSATLIPYTTCLLWQGTKYIF